MASHFLTDPDTSRRHSVLSISCQVKLAKVPKRAIVVAHTRRKQKKPLSDKPFSYVELIALIFLAFPIIDLL